MIKSIIKPSKSYFYIVLLTSVWCRLARSSHPPLPPRQAHQWPNKFRLSLYSLINIQEMVGNKTIRHIQFVFGFIKKLTKRKLDGAVEILKFLLKYLRVSIWCRHLNINLNLKTRFSNISYISNVILVIWCHYLSLNDIRWHKMSLDDIWCLVIEPFPICCQDIPWGGHQRQTELSVCEWVSRWVCEFVNFWFIELPTQLKIKNLT